MRRSSLLTRAAIAITAAFIVVGVVATVAAAHIEPEPSRVKPGATVTVAFNAEHGCDQSPTIKLTFKIPKGATKVAAVAKPGWDATVAKGTVVFDGGTLAATTPDTF